MGTVRAIKEKSEFESFFEAIASKDSNLNALADEEQESKFATYIDTGCYALNGLLSSSLQCGLPTNKITVLAGKSGVGKTYIALGIVRHFLGTDPTAMVLYYDTENAVHPHTLRARGIDLKRVHIERPPTLQDFHTHCLNALDTYVDRKQKNPMIVVLDSLGNLASFKEVDDALKGKMVQDMSRAKIIKSIFRTLTQRIGKAHVAFVLTNHTYEKPNPSGFVTIELSGGTGVQYAADIILMITRAKVKEGDDVVGVALRATAMKSRATKENSRVEMLLSYKKGLDRHYGLLQLGEKHGIFEKADKMYKLPDGSKAYAKTINENPETYFTPEVMALLENAAEKEFSYGGPEDDGD